jgi:hypothetical protein
VKRAFAGAPSLREFKEYLRNYMLMPFRDERIHCALVAEDFRG